MTAPFAPFIRSITPRGFLSFGPDTPPLELRPLNVLIGPIGNADAARPVHQCFPTLALRVVEFFTRDSKVSQNRVDGA